jgi:hypothetical protein
MTGRECVAWLSDERAHAPAPLAGRRESRRWERDTAYVIGC